MATEYDNLSKEFAEGRGRATAAQRAALGGSSQSGLPLFQRYVVLDVIFDPQIIDAKKLEHWEHDLGVSNIKYGVTPPRNAIIARRVQNNKSSPSEQAMILYPFFPPQLSLPCQPGEHVWVMFEDPTGTRKDLGYWMCRIVTSGHAEDVNHTHPHRSHDQSFVPGIKELFEGSDAAVYEFRNGVVAVQDGERYTIPETATLPGGDDAYKLLMTESDGGKLVHHEAVPRYRKRPSEYVLEGGNNTLITLGRDRSGPVAAYKDDDERGQIPKIPSDDVDADGAGAIDLVVGRGQTESTGGKRVENELGKSELDKSFKGAVAAEGDPDYMTDRSRVLISQKTPVDQRFGLSSFNSEFADGSIQGGSSPTVGVKDGSEDGDGAIVVKTDKLRLIARSDVEILVTGFERNDDGTMEASDDPDRYCALVLKANGDIVLRPSVLGFVKLGGDDANMGIVCSDVPVVASEGAVSGPPLLTTMGGSVGGAVATGPGKNKGALAPGQGKYASKVLIK